MKNRTLWILGGILLAAVVLWQARTRNDVRVEQAKSSTVTKSDGGFFAEPATGKRQAGATNSNLLSIQRDPGFPYRLKNSSKSPSEMFRSETGIILRNAHIETTEPLERLAIPAHLKAQGDPGAYIVQANGFVTDEFRKILEEAGAKIVSYIPHNSFLVSASEEVINGLRVNSGVRRAVPFEPYYKLDSNLLPLAVNQEKMPPRRFIRVALFPGQEEQGLQKVLSTGSRLLRKTEFPYGEVLTVYPGRENLVALAQIPEVQLLEVHNAKILLNDLTRVRMGVAENESSENLDLKGTPNVGTDIRVAVMDTGIQTDHPHLNNRVELISHGTNLATTVHSSPLSDASGHGTHVAGIIAADVPVNAGLNPVHGSSAGNIYDGKAPEAFVVPLPIGAAEADPVVTGGMITSVDVTYGSGGYAVPPIVYIFDSTPYTTNAMGVQLTPGAGASYGAEISQGVVTAITNRSSGSNYNPTNTFIVIDPPLSDFQLLTNIAGWPNTIHIVNNSWGTGFGGYDTVAATYDASVRDAMPHWYGEQALNHVFAAGNNGFGTRRGEGGIPDSLDSPATAKNVITVGAVESERNIPSAPAAGHPFVNEETDRAGDVANFSSRGNVGIGLEGEFGRFKPDLVAPGTWILSSASTNSTRTSIDAAAYPNTNNPGFRYESGTSMAAPAISGMLALMEKYFRENFARTNSPALNKALLINSARSVKTEYDISPRANINHQGWGLPSLSNAIPDVSRIGQLATLATTNGQLVFLDQRAGVRRNLKTGETHDYDVEITGDALLAPLRVTLVWTDPPANPLSGIKLVNDLDLSVSNAAFVNSEVYLGNYIAQGEDFNTAFFASTNSDFTENHDIVNNVEQVIIPSVTNSGTARYHIRVSGARVNVNADILDTNEVVQDYALVVSVDPRPGDNTGTRRLTMTYNILTNALTTNRPVEAILNGIPEREQIVGANFQLLTNNFHGSTNQWNFYNFTNVSVGPITNLMTNITGTTTNVTTNVVRPLTNVGPYVAFATYFPPNAGRPRNRDADIDLYMARSGNAPPNGIDSLTNLDVATIEHPSVLRSTNRGGVELLSMTNASIGERFVIGVKSEDQQAGRYSFVALASDVPFTQTNPNGAVVINFLPVPQEIPDGTPDAPGGVTLLGINTQPTNVINPVVSNTISHENFGDLVVSLGKDGTNILLWSHNTDVPPGAFNTRTRIFNTTNPTNRPDGIYDLNSFLEMDALGVWELTIVDDAFNHTGRIDGASLTIGDRNGTRNRVGDQTSFIINLGAGETFVDVVFVDPTVTNMGVFVQNSPNSNPGVDSFVAFNAVPPDPFATNVFQTNINGTNFSTTNVTTNFNVSALYAPATATMTNFINAGTQPPLQPGNWFIRVVNNTAGPLTLNVLVDFYRDITLGGFETFANVLSNNLVDISTTNLTVTVPDFRLVASVEVGVEIEHPRASDLVLRLISPSGNKVLLSENRGWTNENLFANFSEDPVLSTSFVTNRTNGGMLHFTNLIPIKAVTNIFTNVISPPRLLNSNIFNVGENTSPEGIDSIGRSIFIVGTRDVAALSTSFDQGSLLSYPTPMTNNFMPTNWQAWWPGDNPLGNVNRGNVRLKDVAVTRQQLYAVADLNRDYFLVIRPNNGSFEEHITDFDAGTTSGNFAIQFTTFTVLDHLHVYHDGNPIISAPFPGIGTGGFVTSNAAFAGTSSFIRIVFNQGGNTNIGTAWINNGVTITGGAALPVANQSIVLGYDVTGSNFVGEAASGARMLSRGVTNNPYGLYGNDRLFAITTSLEPQHTNFFQRIEKTNWLYVVGSSIFSASTREKFFMSKVHPDGRPIWTSTEQVQADAEVTLSGSTIGSANILFGGTNYSVATPPTVTIVDLFDQGSGATATATVGANGDVTGITINTAGTGYVRPKIEIAKPGLSNSLASAGHDVMVMGGSNVFAVGFTNSGSSDRPAIWNYTTNGYLNWVLGNTNVNGQFHAGDTSRTNVYAVGYTTDGTTTASYVARFDLNGNMVTNQSFTNLSEVAGSPEDLLTEVLAIQNPNRVYALGTRTNIDNSTDAILLELDSLSLNLISSVVINGGGTENDIGKGLTTDGKDLYVTYQSRNAGLNTTEVARFRIRNYYQAEEDLNLFLGEPTWFFYGNTLNQDWTLEVKDNRFGQGSVTNVTPKILHWNLNMTYAASIIPPALVNSAFGFTGTLLSRTPKSFFVDVPQGAQSMTLNFNSSQPISAAIALGSLPAFGETGTTTLFIQDHGQSITLSSATGFNLLPGRYYITVQTGIEVATPTQIELSVAFDGNDPAPVIPLLADGVARPGQIPASGSLKVYRFEVPQGASGAQFELSPVIGDVNLYLRKDDGSGSVPTTTQFDYRSLRSGADPETIFVVPDAASVRGLTPGTWYVGVQNTDTSEQPYTLKASSINGTPYNVIPLPNAAIAHPEEVVGNAPKNMFKTSVPAGTRSVLFQVFNLTGDGDLLVRKGAFPVGSNADAISANAGTAAESVAVRTNVVQTSLEGDWYFGVINRDETNISFSISPRLANPSGLLVSAEPIQLQSLPVPATVQSQGDFSFDLSGVPGERYQVLWSDSLAGGWAVLTNIIAPANGAIQFIHQNIATNRNAFYRIQQVP